MPRRSRLRLSPVPAAFGLLLLGAAPAFAQAPAGALPAAPDFGAARLAPPACLTVPPEGAALALPELVDLALCRNPATAAAWAAARAAAYREQQTRSAYGPRLDGSLGGDAGWSRRSGGGFPTSSDSSATATASLSLGWLLTDFGGREAALAGARAAIEAALAGFADQAQAIVLETGLAYHAANAAVEAETAARSSLEFARVSLAAATARERAGVGIKSDRLQADAAFARAELEFRRAQGLRLTQAGRLATAVSLPPTQTLRLAPPPPPGTPAELRAAADALIAEADRLRPDLRLRAANLAAAEADVAAAEAARRPNLSLGAGPRVSAGTVGQDIVSGTAGLTLSVPLFDSGGRTAAIAAAREEAARSAGLLESARESAALDVWTRYQSLATEAANLATARRLLASAEEAAALAQGRYRAGLAAITELLDAQASLASAREQVVAADFNLRSAELQLARAVGTIGDKVE